MLRERLRRWWHSVPDAQRAALTTTAPARFFYRNVWARPGHFYSPYPDLRRLDLGAGGRPPAGAATVTGVDLRANQQLALLEELLPLHKEHGLVEMPDEEHRYYLSNAPYSYADGVFCSLLLRHFKPSRYLEIGSGFSSLLALDVRDRFLPEMQLTFVDPYPNVVADHAASKELVRAHVQEMPLSMFTSLRANDVLFIDSSHVLKPGSDLEFLMFEVLPVLEPGVLVHFHDIHWPFEYPDAWIRQGRAWNEVYAIRSMLTDSTGFEIVLWNAYLIETDRGWFETNMPLCLRNPGGSLWLRRR